jgi:hypothetical protein
MGITCAKDPDVAPRLGALTVDTPYAILPLSIPALIQGAGIDLHPQHSCN